MRKPSKLQENRMRRLGEVEDKTLLYGTFKSKTAVMLSETIKAKPENNMHIFIPEHKNLSARFQENRTRLKVHLWNFKSKTAVLL